MRSQIGLQTFLAPTEALDSSESLSELAAEFSRCRTDNALRLVVDFTNVPLLSSAALELLLDTQTEFGRLGGSLRLINCNETLTEVLSFTGVSRQLTVDEAPDASPLAPRLVERGRLGDVLVAEGLVSEDVIREVVEIQSQTGRQMGRILVEEGYLPEWDLLQILGAQFGLPVTRLRTGTFDPDISEAIGLDVARRLRMVPLFKIHGEIFVAASNPQAIPSFDNIAKLSGAKVRPVLATTEDIDATLSELGSSGHGLTQLIGELDVLPDMELVDSTIPDDYSVIDEMAGNSPVINLVNALIQRAIAEGASDIHIEPTRAYSRVRFRVDGALRQIMTPPPEMHPALVSRLKVMADLDIAERRLPQDGRIQVFTQGRSVDLRFSSLPGIFGEKVVLRVLDKDASLMKVDQLGMRESVTNEFRALLGRSHGLLLVTGPTGSGKTTTLYAAIRELNSAEKSIVTIEDPVEYQLDSINQNQVKAGVGLGFATILKHVLRQDPDIVMVGEIRERETAEIAVQAALTGHLVLSTLHTNDSVGAITRMIDMGIEPYLLSSALSGVMAQRLIRAVCESCKTSYVAPPGSLAHLGVHEDTNLRLVQGRGCAECYDSGYRGRVPIHELLSCDSSTQRLMISNPSQEALTAHIAERGVTTLLGAGMDKALAGVTSVEEVTRAVG